MLNRPSKQYETFTQASTVGNYDATLLDYIRVAARNAYDHSHAEIKLPESAV